MDSGFRLSPELRSGWRQAKHSFAESRNDDGGEMIGMWVLEQRHA
jgi:hypothetical protein